MNYFWRRIKLSRHSALLGMCREAESGMTGDHGLRCQTQFQIPALLLIICVA